MQKLSKCVWLAVTIFIFTNVIMSCTDNNYDFNEIDTTVGIGSDELKIPVSSTSQIPLADVLTLTEGGIVKVMDNGDYMILRDGNYVNPARPRIDNIYVSGQLSKANDVTISLASPAPANNKFKSSQELSGEADIWQINYESSPQNDIEDLKWATMNAQVSLQIKLSDLRNILTKVKTIKLDMPDYMQFSDVRTSGNIGNMTQTGSGFVFSDISTASDLSLSFNITKMTFGNQLSFNTSTKKVSMLGDVHMGVTIDAADIQSGIVTTGNLTFATSMNLGGITITGAYGRFNPDIDLGNLGETNFSDIPNFLKDKEVVADLHNPQIYLDITNNMPLGGFINGTLKAYKDGALTSTVTVPDMSIAASSTTKLCICRQAEALANEGYSPVIVSNLSQLIATIPDKIVFEANARADKNTYYQLVLGETFEISPQYNITAPIAFGKNARIVYNDTIDNLNKDIKDLDLANGAYLQANANIENRVPAHLTLTAEAFDIDRKPISSDLIEIEVNNKIIASSDGETPVTTPIEIRIKQHAKGALKSVDGIAVRIEGSATEDNSSVVGVTLNANKHTLTAKDIVIRLIGKIIADL